jgi:hypothetical protein
MVDQAQLPALGPCIPSGTASPYEGGWRRREDSKERGEGKVRVRVIHRNEIERSTDDIEGLLYNCMIGLRDIRQILHKDISH